MFYVYMNELNQMNKLYQLNKIETNKKYLLFVIKKQQLEMKLIMMQIINYPEENENDKVILRKYLKKLAISTIKLLKEYKSIL